VERLSESNWRRSEQPIGNQHSGIRSLKSGAFAFVKGRLKDEKDQSESDNDETMQTTTEEPNNSDAYRRKMREILIDRHPNELHLFDEEPSAKEVLKQDEKLQRLIETENKKTQENVATVSRLHFADFELPRQLILEFCIYMTSEGSRLVIEGELKGYCRTI
jgi:hypothetical protein